MKRLGALWLGILLSLQLSFGTGASSIYAKMDPLAINQAGDILCKSFYSENPQGSHHVQDADISLCLVKDGKVTPLQILDQFQPIDDYKRDNTEYDALSDRYHALTFSESSPLLTDLYAGLIAQGFKAIDLKQYSLPPSFSANSFYEKWGVPYQDLTQVVLNSASTPDILEGFNPEAQLTTVQLQYQIGNQIWLSFNDCPAEYAARNACAEDWPLDDGIRAIYYLSPLYYEYKDRDSKVYGKNPAPFGYDYQNINAVIILPEG